MERWGLSASSRFHISSEEAFPYRAFNERWNKSWQISLFQRNIGSEDCPKRNQTKEALFLLIPRHQYPFCSFSPLNPDSGTIVAQHHFGALLAKHGSVMYAFNGTSAFRRFEMVLFSRENTRKYGRKWIFPTGTDMLCACVVFSYSSSDLIEE